MNNQLIQKIESIVNQKDLNEKDKISLLKNFINEYELQSTPAKPSKPITELFLENINYINRKDNFEKVIKTGFESLDKEIGGFLPGEFIVIGGRPAMGKTQLLVNLSINISKAYPILYFTFDLSEFLLTSRFISSLTDIPIGRILQKDLSTEEINKISEIEKQQSDFKIFINDSCNNNISAFKKHCEEQIEKNGIKVIIVDYIQMMSSNKFRNNRESEISFICRELKNIAKEHNVCVIANSQLSRAVESRGGDKRPMLSDLRESGAIEQDADKVIFIYRPEYYGITDIEGISAAGHVELIIAKNRNGKLADVILKRDSNFTNIKDIDMINHDFNFSIERLGELDNPF